jgi:hypothetical protein
MLVTLLLFFLLLLCEHRLGLVDSPGCQSFKRSLMTSIITSTPTNKQPPHQITLGLSEKAKRKVRTCSPLWIFFTNLCKLEKGLPRLHWCRGQKSGKRQDPRQTKKTGAWESHVKVQAPQLLRSRVQFRGASPRRFHEKCDVATCPSAPCTAFTATPPSTHPFHHPFTGVVNKKSSE